LVHILIDMEVGYLDEKYFLEWYEFLKYYYWYNNNLII
jgi:hypothetical protein